MKKGMLGDLLMMTPAIRRLKTLYPKDKVYLYTDERLHCLFKDNQYLDGLNVPRTYDLVIDFDKKYDPTRYDNKIKFYLKLINASINLKLPEMKDEDYQYDITLSNGNFPLEEFKKAFGKYALFSTLCAGKEWKGRQLLDTRPYKRLHTALNKDGINTLEVQSGAVYFGGCNFTHPPCSLDHFVHIVANAELIVTIDTGTLHIAQALHKPVIAIFGKVPPESRIIPKNKNVLAVVKDIPCKGCFANNSDHTFCDNDESCMNLGKDDLVDVYINKIRSDLLGE